MLRSKWDSLKKCIKKEYAEQKQTLYKTGGGPAVEIKLSSVGNRVLAVIGIGATGTVSRYDCDFVEEIPNTESEEVINTIIPLEIIEVPENSWNSWNPTQLRQPISKVLQLPKPSTSATSREGSPSGVSEAEVPVDNTKNKSKPPSCVTKTSNRKRFSKVEPIAAKLQKQRTGVYEQLAQKKIEFIEFQMTLLKEEAERKERFQTEKHNIEIKILEAELANKTN